ncbi:hypothetical protein S83_055825, partial [Arachis hypogaea]
MHCSLSSQFQVDIAAIGGEAAIDGGSAANDTVGEGDVDDEVDPVFILPKDAAVIEESSTAELNDKLEALLEKKKQAAVTPRKLPLHQADRDDPHTQPSLCRTQTLNHFLIHHSHHYSTINYAWNSAVFISPRLELCGARFTTPQAPFSLRLEHHRLRLTSVAAKPLSSSLSLPGIGVPSYSLNVSVSQTLVGFGTLCLCLNQHHKHWHSCLKFFVVADNSLNVNVCAAMLLLPVSLFPSLFNILESNPGHYTNYKASELETVVLALVYLQLNTKANSLNTICKKYKQYKGIRRFQHGRNSSKELGLRSLMIAGPTKKELKARGINNEHTLAYQSRVGPVQWLKPYTDETLVELGQKGVMSLLAVPVRDPDEIDMVYRKLALESGIKIWARVPALDLADIVIEALPSEKQCMHLPALLKKSMTHL